MKKILSLSVAVFMSAMLFAQDTIPAPAMKSIPGPKEPDTIPAINKLKKDTSLLAESKKLPDTVSNKTGLANKNAINPNRDSAQKSSAVKENMQAAKDSLPSKKLQANSNSSVDSATSTTKMIEDRVIMKDDKVIVVKNGDSTLLQDSIKLQSGAIVKKDGNVIYTNGKTAKLNNGQFVTLIPAQSNAEADSTATVTAKSATNAKIDDKVVMKDDKVIVIKNGDSTLLEDSIKLKSGAIVKKDASVKFKDGTSTTLKNGQYISLNPAETKKTKKTSVNKKEKK